MSRYKCLSCYLDELELQASLACHRLLLAAGRLLQVVWVF